MKVLRFFPRFLFRSKREWRRERERDRRMGQNKKATRRATSLSAFKAESKAIHFHFSTLTPSFKSVSFGYYRRVQGAC